MFNRSSFSPVSFSRISFAGAQAANEGRSGYWRMFFANMQEEALKKRDEKTDGDTGKRAAPEVVASKGKKQPKPVVPKKRKVVEAAPSRAPIIPFRKLPTKLEPNAFDLLAELPPLVAESYLLALSSRVIINLDDERIIRRKKKRKLAAFLLMAA